MPELRKECKYKEGILPSLESFANHWRLPKVQYLFYHYFYKAVISDARWKSRMTENKRLRTIIAYAYAVCAKLEIGGRT